MYQLIVDDLAAPASIKVLFISSYVPRKCGIATFCRDLAEGIKKSDPRVQFDIMALVDKLSEELKYPSAVKYLVRQQQWADYQIVLDQLSLGSQYDLVCLQHEYGIYGGAEGEWVINLMEEIDQPIVSTLHTILPNPTDHQKYILQRVCQLSDEVVVMLQAGAEILNRVYQVPLTKISVIPHGVPDFSKVKTQQAKRDLGIADRVVMTSVNLLSIDKGIEYAIRSLPEVIAKVPNFLYQVVGETHPVYLKNELQGKDSYRQGLIALAEQLGVSQHIRFVNKYVSVEELVKFVEASDYYITPYLNPQQATSGALAYAIGAGKLCISTPYLYAKEMLRGGRGILVDFKDSRAMAKAIIKMSEQPAQKLWREKRTRQIGQQMSWTAIGQQYSKIFYSLMPLPTTYPPFSSATI